MINRNTKKKTRFTDFLSGDYAQDYINQDTPYEEQIEHAAKLIREADCVLLGAGAGMSTAAGAEYGGKFFEENFAEFQKLYGKGPYMQDMYYAGFYPFPDQESKWGLWSHLALLAGIDLDVTPLHKTLLDALKGKGSVPPDGTGACKRQDSYRPRSEMPCLRRGDDDESPC